MSLHLHTHMGLAGKAVRLCDQTSCDALVCDRDALLAMQGRVWAGHAALSEKLVDVLGGLTMASTVAKKLAGLGEPHKPCQIRPADLASRC